MMCLWLTGTGTQHVAGLLVCSQPATLGFEVGVRVDKPHLWLGDFSVALLRSQALGEVSHLFIMRELIF